MKLYYHPLSTFSQKVMMAFYEKGVEFKGEIVNMMDPQAKVEYQKIYSFGKIPLVVLDDGAKVSESSIIVEYLDTHFSSGTRLIPLNVDEARQVRFWDRMSDLYLNEPCLTIFMDTLAPAHQKNPQGVEKARVRLENTYEYFSQQLNGRTFLLGENLTMADCAAAPVLVYLQGMHPFGRHVQMASYLERIMKRPSFVRVLKEAQPHMEAFMSQQKKSA